MIRTYSELMELETFEERFRYLALRGSVGHPTFGSDRYLNQMFYSAHDWKRIRPHVIARDEGCDLGMPGYEIHAKLVIHHMNPMDADDIRHGNVDILNPEYLITTTHQTHNAIHYGDEKQLPRPFVARSPGDTKLWG